MIKVAVATLGCRVNQYESAGMAETLKDNGFAVVPFNGTADLYIINTCSVTAKTDYQSRQLIRRAGRNSPGAAILVTGCYAQMFPEEIASIPGVIVVAGNREKDGILPLIREALRGEKKIIKSDVRKLKEFSTPETGAFPGRTRALLKIQDGCDTFCSYCIVPHARGRSRSLHESEVMKRMKNLSEAGYRELVLTGVNLGAYGRDLAPPTDLFSLLGRIAQAGPLPRLRLSSLEPREITDGLLGMIRDNGIFCRHLHIPFQSGDDKVLSLMGRDYDAAFFRSLVEKILQYLPDAAIGIDIMTGFPGEGDEEFSNTRKLIEELPIAYIHVFPYSARPGVPASAFPGQVTDSDKRRRAASLRSLAKEKREAFAQRFLGRELDVLLEGKRDGAFMQGFSRNYIRVVLENGESCLANNMVKVIAGEMREGKLIGRIIK